MRVPGVIAQHESLPYGVVDSDRRRAERVDPTDPALRRPRIVHRLGRVVKRLDLYGRRLVRSRDDAGCDRHAVVRVGRVDLARWRPDESFGLDRDAHVPVAPLRQ